MHVVLRTSPFSATSNLNLSLEGKKIRPLNAASKRVLSRQMG